RSLTCQPLSQFLSMGAVLLHFLFPMRRDHRGGHVGDFLLCGKLGRRGFRWRREKLLNFANARLSDVAYGGDGIAHGFVHLFPDGGLYGFFGGLLQLFLKRVEEGIGRNHHTLWFGSFGERGGRRLRSSRRGERKR